MDDKPRYFLFALLGVFFCALLMAFKQPGLFSSAKYISSLILVEIILFCLWRYENRFFPLLIVVFLWAGGPFPYKELAATIRWVVLAVAACGGFVVWLGARRHKFGPFHFMAVASVVAGVASSLVSANTTISTLKISSLGMLFLYAATGGRAIFWHDPPQFLKRLTVGGELIVFASTICYFLLRFPMFGNPNSLGAVMAFIEPLLFWQVLVNSDPRRRPLHITALVLSGALLYTSAARAAIVSAALATLLLCVTLRRFRILPKVALASALIISLGGVLQPSSFPEFLSSVTGDLIYKKANEQGIFASRLNPWNEALTTIKAHPWVGSGFGTRSGTVGDTDFLQTRSYTNFEYGNSYLSILDYTGLIGVTFFGGLIFHLASRVAAISLAIPKNPDLISYAVPLMLVVVVGLLHAIFEDWLFAPGSYICIFFWCCAFLFMDFKPSPVSGQEMRHAPRFSYPNQVFQPPAMGMPRASGSLHGQTRPI